MYKSPIILQTYITKNIKPSKGSIESLKPIESPICF